MTGIAVLLFSAAAAFAAPAPDPAVHKSPRLAVTLSLVPGGGQAYNGKYAKALVMFGAGAGLAGWRMAESGPAVREKLSWWLVGLYIYNLLDAYVDAHLAGFDRQSDAPIEPPQHRNTDGNQTESTE